MEPLLKYHLFVAIPGQTLIICSCQSRTLVLSPDFFIVNLALYSPGAIEEAVIEQVLPDELTVTGFPEPVTEVFSESTTSQEIV